MAKKLAFCVLWIIGGVLVTCGLVAPWKIFDVVGLPWDKQVVVGLICLVLGLTLRLLSLDRAGQDQHT
ncbi:hypothetical protein [Burkholderia contaminans]|uniref:hypothetical protein n=1 Tax=Burkholderia contaminans TaxID=488447 RepID=UPI003D669ED6